MAFASTFYDTLPGEGVKETTWAQSAASRGDLYGVVGKNDFELTAHPTTPYAVNISAGKAFGNGVWDDVTGVTRVDTVAPATGATRWDLIAIRRDWQPTGGGPSSMVAVRGTTAAAIPTTRENRPGIVADQPLWLVQWVGGQTQPKSKIDLRVFSGPGGLEINHELARNYLEYPGARLKLGKLLWCFESQANSTWSWEKYQLVAGNASIVRDGYKVVWTNVDGFTTVPFDEVFPTACKSAVGGPMNPPVNGAVIQFISASAAGANFRCFDLNGNPLKSQRVGISYIATGW